MPGSRPPDTAAAAPETAAAAAWWLRVWFALGVRRFTLADHALHGMVLTLPWSTSVATVFFWSWVVLLPLEWRRLQGLRGAFVAATLLPLAIAGYAALAVLWSEGTRSEALVALAAIGKLVALPLLAVYARRRPDLLRVLAGGLIASCTALLALSYLSFVFPETRLRFTDWPGIAAHDRIAQSGFFALAGAIVTVAAWHLRTERRGVAVAAMLLAAAFFANVAFVAGARSALIFLAVAAVAAVLRAGLSPRRLAVASAVAVAVVGAAAVSPEGRGRIATTLAEIDAYTATGAASSSSWRIEWVRYGMIAIAEAPVFGHGTGSVRAVFTRIAEARGDGPRWITSNPHNQLLLAGVDGGAVLVLLIVAMWLVHARHAFAQTSAGSAVFALVLVQNIVGSMFNSHLSDFVQGYVYVLFAGLALAGSLDARADSDARAARPA